MVKTLAMQFSRPSEVSKNASAVYRSAAGFSASIFGLFAEFR
jgi:hypothetical protein